MRKWIITSLMLFAAVTVIGNLILAQNGKAPRVSRAKPPQFSQSEQDLFFADVFSEGLSGERPADLGKPPVIATTNGSGTPDGGTSGGGSGVGWSKVVSAAALEDEIKALKLKVDRDVTTPIKFQSTGHKLAQRNFGQLAMLFAIVGDYDGDVRWKEDGPAARDVFARTANNAKVGTIQVYNEAKLRKQDLADLIGGARLTVAGNVEQEIDWQQVCTRRPLMQRLEAAHQGNMQPMTANEGEFKKNKDTLRHEANILAAIAVVLQQEGMEDGTDEDYAAMAERMNQAAHEIIEAVKVENYDQAREAVGNIGKACSECHELYKG